MIVLPKLISDKIEEFLNSSIKKEMKIQSKERVAGKDIKSKERIALLQEETKKRIASLKPKPSQGGGR